jgi:hypothetical protein
VPQPHECLPADARNDRERVALVGLRECFYTFAYAYVRRLRDMCIDALHE